MSGVPSRSNITSVGVNFQQRKKNQWLELMVAANFQKFWGEKKGHN